MTTKKEFQRQLLQTRTDDLAERDRAIANFRISDTVKSILLERGVTLTRLASELCVARTTLHAWIKSPYWASDPLVIRFNRWSGKNLFQLALTGGLPYNPPKSPGRVASNLAEKDKYLPSSFGRVLFEYLAKNNLSVVELEDQLGCYRNQLHFIAKRKVKIKEELYQKLCEISDTFVRFFPWNLRQPKLEEHDIKMRDLVMFYYAEQETIEKEFYQQKTKEDKDKYLESKKGN